MRLDKLTTKFQQALADAQSIAVGGDVSVLGISGGNSELAASSLGQATRAARAKRHAAAHHEFADGYFHSL